MFNTLKTSILALALASAGMVANAAIFCARFRYRMAQ
jgi:hypothetical protein